MNRIIKVRNGVYLDLETGQTGVFRKNKNGSAYFIPNDTKKNVGYHYGDLGKARDTNYFAMNSGSRSTGHFGTGTYFLGKKEEGDGYFSRKDRPLHEIDFKDYKLYQPKNETEAFVLNAGLKAINNKQYEDYNFKALTNQLKDKKRTMIEINSALYKTIKYDDSLSKANFEVQAKADSLSTVFMKELGYEGIDVRGIEKYDNTEYGSVIYDIKKRK